MSLKISELESTDWSIAPLHDAARLGSHDKIVKLLAAGAQINEVFKPGQSSDSRWCTPLMAAAGSGEGATVETLALLLKFGARPSQRVGGETAVTLACRGLNYRTGGGDAERLQFLLANGGRLPRYQSEANALVCDVARSGRAAQLMFLLHAGANPHGAYSVRHEVREVFRSPRLIRWCGSKRNRPVSEMSPEEESAIQRRILAEQLENSRDAVKGPWSSNIPLFRAAESGNAECVRLLLDAGADPLFRDRTGETPIFGASSVEVIRTLMAAGVPLETGGAETFSPLHHCVLGGSDEQFDAFLAAGASVHDASLQSTLLSWEFRSMRKIRSAFAAGATFRFVPRGGGNAFHDAVHDRDAFSSRNESSGEVLGFVKSLGIDINLRDHRGLTPLMYSVCKGSTTDVEILCELGADTNACALFQDDEKREPPEMLPILFHIENRFRDRIRCTAALLQHGADPLWKDTKGRTVSERWIDAFCDESDFDKIPPHIVRKGLEEIESSCRPFLANRAACIDLLQSHFTYWLDLLSKVYFPSGDEGPQYVRPCEWAQCVALVRAHEVTAREFGFP